MSRKKIAGICSTCRFTIPNKNPKIVYEMGKYMSF